jgi:hypothetical protein
MFTRWLTASLVAIGLGVAALELSASPAGESHAATATLYTDAGGPGLPIGAEIHTTEVSALPRFTK